MVNEQAPEAPNNIVFLGDHSAEMLVFLTDSEGRYTGWAAFFGEDASPSGGGPTCFVRFAPIAGSSSTQYDIVEFYLAAPSITGRDLRSQPLGRMEVAVNQASHAERMGRFAGSRQGSLGIAFPDLDLAGLADMHRGHRMRRPRMRLNVPEGNRKPDSFYEQVAHRYGWLMAEGASAAAELAEANGVPASTVHRWVKEARRRGLLAPGARGRRGAGK